MRADSGYLRTPAVLNDLGTGGLASLCLSALLLTSRALGLLYPGALL